MVGLVGMVAQRVPEMNAIDVAERQALASPRDYPEDFWGKLRWQVCGDCIRAFIGAPTRITCRVCVEVHKVRQ